MCTTYLTNKRRVRTKAEESYMLNGKTAPVKKGRMQHIHFAG
jgi:hypothetical protein